MIRSRLVRGACAALMMLTVTACTNASPDAGPSTSVAPSVSVPPNEAFPATCDRPAQSPGADALTTYSFWWMFVDGDEDNVRLQYDIRNDSDLVAYRIAVRPVFTIDGEDVTGRLSEKWRTWWRGDGRYLPPVGPHRQTIVVGDAAGPQTWKDAGLKYEIVIDDVSWCVPKPGAYPAQS